MRKKPYEFRPCSENRAPESSGRGAQFPSARSLTRSTTRPRLDCNGSGQNTPEHPNGGHERVALLGRSSRRGSPLTRRVYLAESSGKANTIHHAMCQRPDVRQNGKSVATSSAVSPLPSNIKPRLHNKTTGQSKNPCFTFLWCQPVARVPNCIRNNPAAAIRYATFQRRNRTPEVSVLARQWQQHGHWDGIRRFRHGGEGGWGGCVTTT